ncbi:MAG: O-acetyl-ADP-ribose deacetylase [Ruminococcaceae bacterium]|nr:O-acetyl-ADP-ribose deacetylase [Oscillospiraceae bacterium]
MPLKIIRDDITRVRCDAIVNAANSSLLGGGGVDGAIHRAAGKKLLEECRTLGGCNMGEAKITKGYNLPAKYVIHTVGPVWRGGGNNEKALLESCYGNSLKLAKEYNCKSVAFPLISAGVYGYPAGEALDVAVKKTAEFLEENEMTVYIVVFDKNALSESRKRFSNVEQYIDDIYAEAHSLDRSRRIDADFVEMGMPAAGNFTAPKALNKASRKESEVLFNNLDSGLEHIINETIDESFSQMLLRKIDEKGMTDSECYKKANIDRKLFSKIRSDVHYKPSKPTALAFAIALELSLDETKDLLMKAGFALSHSNKSDIIIEYFIKNKNYNIFTINEALFAFDQALLGA